MSEPATQEQLSLDANTSNQKEPPVIEPTTKEDVKTLMKEFSFQLTDADLAKKATQLGELSAEMDAAQAKLDAAKGSFKSVEGQIKVAQRDIIDAIRTRREMRSVWCEEVKDFEHGRVYWRPKNANPGDPVLGERPMTNDERQIQLKLDEKKAKDAKDANTQAYEEAAKKPAEEEITTQAQWDAMKGAGEKEGA